MSGSSRARRLPAAAAVVMSAALLGGCSYAEAGTLPAPDPAPSTSVDTFDAGDGVAPEVPLDPRHDADDVAFVSAALVHHGLTVQLADLMRAETRAPDEAVAVADTLVADQAPDVDALSRLLRLWGEPLPDTQALPLAELGEEFARSTATTRDGLSLLDGQRDNEGFTPFWVLTVQTHQEALVDLARREVREGSSSTAREIAQDFVTEQRALTTSLTSIDG